MLDDNSDLLASTSEILRDRLYFVAFKKNHKPKNTTQLHYFSIDDDFVYENFYNDFGPLNICMLFRYCQKLSTKLTAKCHSGKKIIHYTSMNSAKRLNAAYLIGSYSIIYLHKTSEEVFRLLTAGETPAYTRFCDASYGPSNFKISLIDCLNAVYKALRAGFFDFNDFDAEEYEFYERVENGDFNWIVPQKFIAFCGPHQLSKTLPNGYPCHAPQTYFEYFRANNVTTVIRLNAKVYHASSFVNAGFDHKDLFFVDGSTPSDPILKKFLSICETTKGAIAVHCKAGLGRTGSLIGAYIMKHYNFTALEAIAWLRLCRPGSVIGHQQQWMEDKQAWLWSEGERLRDRHNAGTPVHVYGIYSISLKQKTLEDAANDNPELLPPLVKGISQRVDTMHLNDGEEVPDPNIIMPPQTRLERQNSRGSSNRKTRARSLASGQRKDGIKNMNNNGGGLSSLSASGASDEDIVDGDVNPTMIMPEAASIRRRKSPNLTNIIDVDIGVGGGSNSAPLLRKTRPIAVEQACNSPGASRLTAEPLYSERKLKKPSIATETTTTHNKHTIASAVKMTQAAIERQNAQTQGDKLNQIKAMRRHHNSRATLSNSNTMELENPIRHTRARSQPFRNNNNNIVNVYNTTTSPLQIKHLAASSPSNLAECIQHNVTTDVDRSEDNNAISTSDQLNNNINISETLTTTTANNNNNFTSAITTRARSLAIYSKRMGIMHLRKGEALQQKDSEETTGKIHSAASGIGHHIATTTTFSSLNKQIKTYNNTLLTSTSNTNNIASIVTTNATYDSKIPVVRGSTTALIDLNGTVCQTSTVPDASATIPPIRSRVSSHHYTLRGRSRVRYHNRTVLATGATTTSATTVSLSRSSQADGRCRDPSTLSLGNTVVDVVGVTTRSTAALDLNSNPLEENQAVDKNSNNNVYHSHHAAPPTSSSICELNNNLNSSALPSSCTFDATNRTEQIQNFRSIHSTGIPIHHYHHYGQQLNQVSIASSMKRNKRSLSNARIEKEKCDEYNNKLLRKTRTTAATSNTNSNIVYESGSFKGRKQNPNSTKVNSTSTSTNSAVLVIDATSTKDHPECEDEQQQQQQHLLLKLRKKVSY